jgi:plasmid maintenance system antidote protein VapI
MESEGVTPVQLSKSLGVNRQRVNNIFKAKDLKWSTVLRICNALGVDTNRFAE